MFYKFNKPTGVYANKTVRSLQRELKASKIGHIGILDPLAEGLMIVATDFETKLLQYIDNKSKTYIAKAKLHYSSETYDTDSELIFHNEEKISLEQLINAVKYMKTTTSQLPPIWSAKKISGKKAYEYARNDEQVILKEQSINIHKYEILNFDYDKQEAKFLISVSEGTYIRSLLVDTAKYLNIHCVMSELKRIQVGKISLGNLQPNDYELIPVEELINLKQIELSIQDKKYIQNGNAFYCKNDNGMYLLINPANNLICAIGEIKDNIFQPKKVALERV
ncbi:tRNA pseudouridine(55) synthase TruB [Mycoplasmopsis verecunda]|uniref:tRNA pseudouridine(55) synthase n=1 Tax=Mycoplasmopsis verecunda TaxID=171291 RepID=A0A1T4KSZ9_9BACT|nr:tRNA pseudouridine(55) synthase TruB [Mycoplasmopsis verecunda]WPB54665.1 tRNA pseudouridine(55) synthase TruB [Mycoplasmopsis verecunda]SJZ45565.1 tRNA pseudouridine55 synthase [Mycoplasmopsis verecunda]